MPGIIVQITVEFYAEFLKILFDDDDLYFQFSLKVQHLFIFSVYVKMLLLQMVKLFPYLMLKEAELFVHFQEPVLEILQFFQLVPDKITT